MGPLRSPGMSQPIPFDIVLPFVLGPVVLALMWLPRWRKRPAHGAEAGFCFVLIITFIFSFVLQEGVPTWPLGARWHAVPVLLTGVSLVSWAWFRPRRATDASRPVALDPLCPADRVSLLRGLLFALFCGAMSTVVVRLPGHDTWSWRLGLGFIVCLLATSLLSTAVQKRGAAIPLSLAGVLATLSALLLISHFAKLAIIIGCVAWLCAIAGVIAWLVPHFTVGSPGAVTLATLIPTVALTGYSYDYDTFSPYCWILVSSSVFMLWVGRIGSVRRRSPRLRGVIQTLAVLAPCAVALAIALWPIPMPA